jgi:hypothetical protein
MKTNKSITNRSGKEKSLQNVLAAVGLHLAELRQQKGYSTIKEFTDHYDLPEIQYWRIERGKTNITLKSLSRILNIHRLSIQDFFCLLEGGTPA